MNALATTGFRYGLRELVVCALLYAAELTILVVVTKDPAFPEPDPIKIAASIFTSGAFVGVPAYFVMRASAIEWSKPYLPVWSIVYWSILPALAFASFVSCEPKLAPIGIGIMLFLFAHNIRRRR